MSSSSPVHPEYPFQSHFLERNGQRMHYLDEGHGEPLLLVHGNPTWSFIWRHLIRDLKDRYRLIAVDHLGCGLSDKPQDYDYTLRNHIDNLVHLVETLNLTNLTLIAHDWGGAIGMGAAVRLPERFERFVLMNTAAFRSTRIPLRIAVCRIPLLGTLGIRGLNLFARAALKMASAHPERLSRETKQGYLLPYGNWHDRIATDQFVKDIPLRSGHRSYSTLLEVEQGLTRFQTAPTLFLWGEQDWCFTLDFLKEFQQRFPQAETVTFPEASHYLFEDAPERVRESIEKFLVRHPLRSA